MLLDVLVLGPPTARQRSNLLDHRFWLQQAEREPHAPHLSRGALHRPDQRPRAGGEQALGCEEALFAAGGRHKCDAAQLRHRPLETLLLPALPRCLLFSLPLDGVTAACHVLEQAERVLLTAGSRHSPGLFDAVVPCQLDLQPPLLQRRCNGTPLKRGPSFARRQQLVVELTLRVGLEMFELTQSRREELLQLPPFSTRRLPTRFSR
eukprot:1045967-Rhodomonas_salina.2